MTQKFKKFAEFPELSVRRRLRMTPSSVLFSDKFYPCNLLAYFIRRIWFCTPKSVRVPKIYFA